MSETWIILGATSSMAKAFARAVAERGDGVLLAGRDMDDLKRSAADCAQRGAAVAEAVKFDARKRESFAPIYKRALREDGMINVAVFVGSMPAYKIKNRVLALIAEGVLKQDVLPLLQRREVLVPEVRSPAA